MGLTHRMDRPRRPLISSLISTLFFMPGDVLFRGLSLLNACFPHVLRFIAGLWESNLGFSQFTNGLKRRAQQDPVAVQQFSFHINAE